MIKSLSIQNFQSHHNSYLEFDKGVNIIVGSSDSGKTAIIRSIKKLTTNKPLGDEMMSYWGGKLELEMFTDDAHVVYKKDKEAEYILGDTHFKAFKTDVPEEITQVLNMSNINMQYQLDQPFLLNNSPGEVASFFNKVAKLDKIDTATQNINSWIRELTSDIKYEEGQEKSLQEEVKKFEYLEKFEIDIEVLEEQEKQFRQLCNSKDKLETILNSYQINGETILEYQETIELEKPVNSILNLYNERAELDLKEVKLDKLVSQLKELQTEIYEQNELILLEKPVNSILNLYNEKKEAELQHEKLFKAITQLNNIKMRLENANEKYNALKDEFEEVMPTGSICPLCNQVIKK